MRNLLIIFIIFYCGHSWAGLSELSVSTSYRETLIGVSTKSISKSVTGTYAFYFAEMSAIELSYTSAKYESLTTNSLDPTKVTTQTALSQFYGLDFVFAFAGRQSSFQPYVKLGAIYMDKEYFLDPGDIASRQTDFQRGWAPSAGVGFKYKITQTLAIKFSVDAWSSPIDDDRHQTTYDTAARFGISWYL